MLTISAQDKELIAAIRQYNKTFNTELIPEEMLKIAENGAFNILGLPLVDKKKLIKRIKEAIKTGIPLKNPDVFFELAGFSQEWIEQYHRGEIIVD